MNNKRNSASLFFVHEKFQYQASENITIHGMKDSTNALNDIVIVTQEPNSEAPLINVPYKVKLSIAIGMMISLIIGSFCKSIMYKYMLTTNKNNRGWVQRPINVLTIVSALTHHVTHFIVGFWYILTLLVETPLGYVLGGSVCNFTQLTGLYGLGYLNIGSLGIAVYRLLYMKHEHFVKYVVGEQLLLWIILSVGLVLTGTLLYLFTLESSSYRFHMNMCYGWSITDAQSWLEYEHYSGHPIITTTYLQTTSIAACLFIQSIEFGICAWFLQHRYKRDNGNIKKFLTQEAVRERNVKNISTFVGQFYCFVTEYSFLIIVFIFTFLADENSPDFKALAVILKFADFGLLSFVEVLSSPPLRAFMKQSI